MSGMVLLVQIENPTFISHKLYLSMQIVQIVIINCLIIHF